MGSAIKARGMARFTRGDHAILTQLGGAMDVEGTMQFILEQQAQFAADIQVMKEVSKAQQERFERDINQISTVLLDVATSQQRTNEILAVLAERNVDLGQRVADLSDRNVDLGQRVADLSDRIVNLAALMERHIASHN